MDADRLNNLFLLLLLLVFCNYLSGLPCVEKLHGTLTPIDYFVLSTTYSY